jgi:hypothetical protein
MNLRPTMWTPGLFGPDFDEAKFPIQLRIIHDLVTAVPVSLRFGQIVTQLP